MWPPTIKARSSIMLKFVSNNIADIFQSGFRESRSGVRAKQRVEGMSTLGAFGFRRLIFGEKWVSIEVTASSVKRVSPVKLSTLSLTTSSPGSKFNAPSRRRRLFPIDVFSIRKSRQTLAILSMRLMNGYLDLLY